MKNKLKFFRNIVITVFFLAIACYIVDTAPNYKKDEITNKTNIIIDNQNVTAKLKYDVYIDKNKIVYLSYEDIKEFIDKNIFLDLECKQIIMTSTTKVASLNINNKILKINGVEKQISYNILKNDYTIFIPISELNIIYNMQTQYNEENNIVIVDFLDKELIQAECINSMKLKKWSTDFSRTIGKLEQGEKIIVVNSPKKMEGWTKVRTSQGLIGYIKDNSFTNKVYIRENINYETNINLETANLKEYFITDILDEILKSYVLREQIIENILNVINKEELDGIKLNLANSKENNKEAIYRFIIELTPRAREIGKVINITNNNIIEL